MMSRPLKTLFPALCAAGLLSGCIILDEGARHRPGYHAGPPAHAPAHGYRRKHQSHELEFDSGLGVYIVLGRSGYYWWDDHYWRLIDDHWHWTVDLHGPWRIVEIERVPHQLYRRHPGRGLHRGHDDDHRHYPERDAHERSSGNKDQSGKSGESRHDAKHENHPGRASGKGKGKDKGRGER